MMRRIKQGAILLLLSLLISSLGIYAVRENYRNELSGWDFERITAYQKARQAPDARLASLRYELQSLEAEVQGTVVLLFDQCTPNAYEIVYANLKDFGMAGSLVFRDVLPGEPGAITEEQWSEMQKDGWSAVLAADEDLISHLEEKDYAKRLSDYVNERILALEAKGFPSPKAYSFAQGEYNENTLAALRALGITAFCSPDVETGVYQEGAVVFKESYMSSGPNAPLLRAHVEAIKNTADALVIKTRYVEQIEDLTKDTEILKFRAGMLSSLSVYRGSLSLRISSMDDALGEYQEELDKLADLSKRRQQLVGQIAKTKDELSLLWDRYRSGTQWK